VLKRWWDNADSLMAARKVAYRELYLATYDMSYRAIAGAEDAPEVDEAHERFQKAIPEFYLCASPTALSISDAFYSRWSRYWMEKKKRFSGTFTEADLRRELIEAANVLREAMKTELFLTHPTFQLERLRARRKWKAFGNLSLSQTPIGHVAEQDVLSRDETK